MNIAEEAGKFLASFVQSIKSESVEWQKQRQADLLKLKEERAIAEKKLQHKLDQLELEFKGERERIQIEEDAKTSSFRGFLSSIDQTRSELLKLYPKMQQPVALMIHHHATQLLIDAWHNPDISQAQSKHTKFLNLMVTISSDIEELTISGGVQKLLPEKTIAFIKDNSNH